MCHCVRHVKTPLQIHMCFDCVTREKKQNPCTYNRCGRNSVWHVSAKYIAIYTLHNLYIAWYRPTLIYFQYRCVHILCLIYNMIYLWVLDIFMPKHLTKPWVHSFLAWVAPLGIELLTLATLIPCSTSWDSRTTFSYLMKNYIISRLANFRSKAQNGNVSMFKTSTE